MRDLLDWLRGAWIQLLEMCGYFGPSSPSVRVIPFSPAEQEHMARVALEGAAKHLDYRRDCAWLRLARHVARCEDGCLSTRKGVGHCPCGVELAAEWDRLENEKPGGSPWAT